MTSSKQTTQGTAKKVTRWGQERRLEFIDFRLAWDGKLNRADLMDFFGISVPQASIDLARYKELAPDNLTYDASARMYVAAGNFTPLFRGSSPETFLSEALAAESGQTGSGERLLGWRPAIARMPVPGRAMDPKVLFKLLTALREQRALEVLYQSIQRPEPSARVLSPHALGHDGFRWHVRAFCHLRRGYRDFLLARILSASSSPEEWHSGQDDSDWHTSLTLVLAPHPKLSKASQKVIELDYGMTGGQVGIACRKALAFYVLRHLGLDEEHELRPEVQQVVLKNKKEVRKQLQITQPV